MNNCLEIYAEENVERYCVRHKYLNTEEKEYQYSVGR